MLKRVSEKGQKYTDHLRDEYSRFCDAERMACLTTPTNDAHAQ